jgi:hypothetical protein
LVFRVIVFQEVWRPQSCIHSSASPFKSHSHVVHADLMSALHEGEWPATGSDRFFFGTKLLCQLDRRLSVSQGQSGRSENRRIPYLCHESNSHSSVAQLESLHGVETESGANQPPIQ